MEAKCCDPSREPGVKDNANCIEGHQCCAFSGEWVCNNGDGSYPCQGLERGPWGHTCAGAES
jgi:hypothetical protein